MPIRCWLIKAWKEAVWHQPIDTSQWPVFHHIGTDVRDDCDEEGRTVGETVWSAWLLDGSLLGVSWEWVEVRPGVPALRDPNGFVSNACLIGEDGQRIDETGTIVGLNRIAYTVAWQKVVRRVLKCEGSDADEFVPIMPAPDLEPMSPVPPLNPQDLDENDGAPGTRQGGMGAAKAKTPSAA